ncbi:hypothetical protein BM221_004726 [Beauveria bassiana]|uniref:Ricin B lectin domain-containing protein n=1 Tax=Beauveria bassiana TaxID=176275 RepID=A0A2N6NS50_BEABA|nr:hypothetical protein BM221_004726 [Beauveria bassiana]
MGNRRKIKPVSGINSNAWYHVTEGRVDRAGRRFSNMLQVDSSSSGLIVSFQPFNDTSSEESSSTPRFFVLRNSRDGAAKQLSACHNETEPAPGQTGLCMAAADGADAAQVWQIDQWGNDIVDADADDGHAHYSVGYHHPQELPMPSTASQELPTPTPASQELPTPTTVSQELSTPATASQKLSTPTTASQELYTPSAVSSSPPPPPQQQVAREFQLQRYELDCTPVSR